MPSEKSVAVFSFAYSPFEGGAEIAAREIITRLPKIHWKIFTHRFDARWSSEESLSDHVEIIRCGSGRRYAVQEGSTTQYYGRLLDKITYIIRVYRAAERFHREQPFRAIWAMMASYGGIAALFFKFRHPTIPFLVSLQEGDSPEHLRFGKLGLVGFFWKRILRKADYIQVISSYLRDFAIARGARCPIEIVPNGVDWERFQIIVREEKISELKQRLGITDEYVILTTSRLVHKNGTDILIRAMQLLRRNLPNVKCVIVGDGPERNQLSDLTQKLKLESNIQFVGQVPQKEIPYYFQITDVFIRPSRSEGLGSSFLEAMAAGIPIVATPVGGIVDFLKDGETGFVTKVDDPSDCAIQLQRALTNVDQRKKIIIRAQQLIQEKYTWGKVVSAMSRIFGMLIK
ncbi:MAG TPA: glycosyltransferase family 4 protein [Candidatus Paceibacterota bacterium]